MDPQQQQVPDWYELLQVKPDATLLELRAAFKKRTRDTHPDLPANQKNPKAKEMFILVRKAWEILSDEKARAAFDALLKVKAARMQRERDMDAKRKSMRDDLIARENAYKKQRVDEERAKANFEAEMERMKRDGWRKLKEEEEAKDKQAQQPTTVFGKRPAPQIDTSLSTLKVSWNSEQKTFDAEKLRVLFERFGKLLFIKAKSKSAIVVFERLEDASDAQEAFTVGDSQGLRVKFAEETTKKKQQSAPPPPPAAASSTAFPPSTPTAPLAAHLQAEAHEDFELAVLAKLRAAAAAKQQVQ